MMMKRIFRLIFIFIMMTVVCASFLSCKKKPKDEGDVIDIPGGTPKPEPADQIKYTDIVLAGKNDSDYRIVISNQADALEQSAATIVQATIKKAVGAELEVVKDSQISFSDEVKLLSVGQTAIARQAGFETKESLGYRGIKLTTIGKSVFMSGYTPSGTREAVNKFLNLMLGYEQYTKTLFTLNHAEILYVPLLDITSIPDIQYNLTTFGPIVNDAEWAESMAYVPDNSLLIAPNNTYQYYHNSLFWLEPAIYREKHFSWFAKNANQLCYEARGNKTEFEEMTDVLARKFGQALVDNSDKNFIVLGQMDDQTWCSCDACKRTFEKYGTSAPSVIWFCNVVKRKVDNWLKDTAKQPNRKFELLFFAYTVTTNAPVKTGADGEYVPMDETVKCDNGVNVFYAPIKADYTQSFYNEVNKEYYATLKKWKALSDRIYLWTYASNFRHYLLPFNFIDSVQGIYRCANEVGVEYLFDELQDGQRGATGFSMMKPYLNYHLSWDVNADLNVLIDNWFDGYFREASAPMRKLFDELRTQFLYQQFEQGTAGESSIYRESMKAEFWPRMTCERWLGYINEAVSLLEPLKTQDYELYREVYKGVVGEALPYLYFLSELHTTAYTDSQLREIRLKFKQYANLIGLTYLSENVPIDGVYSMWGI